MNNKTMNICPRCGGEYNEGALFCPHCRSRIVSASASGIPDGPKDMSSPDAVPSTIEELKEWYIANNLPPEETTRFFIGKNILEKRAFGIFRDMDGSVVVYKNKDDGTRAVRYRGPDEALGVNELWIRLKQEIHNQKGHLKAGTAAGKARRRKSSKRIFSLVILDLKLASFAMRNINSRDRGYYRYNDEYYYYSHSTWYRYDDLYDTWMTADIVDSLLRDSWRDYYLGDDYNASYGTGDFLTSDYYYDTVQDTWSDDSDTFWDFLSDAWDSSVTDFSSDW